MSRLRLLRQMAGLLPTPYEKRLQREEKMLARYARDLQQREALMLLIQRRERGDADTRPMPNAIPRTGETIDE